ncbi:hypothetical protein Tco_0588521 [Tanacetum coccineum]
MQPQKQRLKARDIAHAVMTFVLPRHGLIHKNIQERCPSNVTLQDRKEKGLKGESFSSPSPLLVYDIVGISTSLDAAFTLITCVRNNLAQILPANVVTDALSRKERVKPRHVRAMAMTIQYGVNGMILISQSEAFKQENVPLVGSEMDKAHASRSLILWAEIGESSLTGPELVLDMTNKVVLRKEKLKAARDRQKSYADNRRKPLEFEVGDRVMLKVSPWKGVIHFGKKGKLAPSLQVPLDEIKVDKALRFVKEPVENSDREVKRLKCSRMVVVKVHLGSKRGL